LYCAEVIPSLFVTVTLTRSVVCGPLTAGGFEHFSDTVAVTPVMVPVQVGGTAYGGGGLVEFHTFTVWPTAR
jgi:hypothetical protein